MKRILAVFLAAVMVFMLSGCGISFTAKKTVSDSELFTERAIHNAMFQVYKKFAFNFEGCILLEIEYDEEYSKPRGMDWADSYGYDEGIVLLSKFYVAAETDGSLEPGKTYDKWNWVLVRNKGGAWELITWGYG